jgi:hypothetical protein
MDHLIHDQVGLNPEVVHVSFLADDVVLTSVDHRYYGAGGEAVSAGRPTYVSRYRDGTWSIVAGQNTAVGRE